METRATRSGYMVFWKVPGGDSVVEGQVVASMEQGKGSMAITAPCSGKLEIPFDRGMT